MRGVVGARQVSSPKPSTVKPQQTRERKTRPSGLTFPLHPQGTVGNTDKNQHAIVRGSTSNRRAIPLPETHSYYSPAAPISRGLAPETHPMVQTRGHHHEPVRVLSFCPLQWAHGQTWSSRTPLFRASFRMLLSPAGGNLRSHKTELGTLFRTDIQVLKICGSILYSWLKLQKTNLSSATP